MDWPNKLTEQLEMLINQINYEAFTKKLSARILLFINKSFKSL